MKKYLLWMTAAILALPATMHATDNISFSTFVASGPIASATGGDNSTIAFTYAGNEFVGSTYFDNQLYSTNLSGGNVTAFGSPLPDCSGCVGEVVLGASLGQGGFANGNIFAGSGANGNIYQYANSGGTPSLFATVPSGTVRQIFFDPGSTFGGDMLVTTTTGNIYKITSAGVVTLLASVGEDAEGMDIAPSTWGPYAGDLLVSSEAGVLRVISPSGVVSVVGSFAGAETVSTVPLGLDASNPLEGFYVANYPFNVQFASAGQFVSQGLLGTVIVTDEFGGSTAWDVSWNGTSFVTTPFTFTGNSINQFEDGIFVTPQRILDTGSTPEPPGLILLGTGLAALAGLRFRKMLTV